MREVNTQRDVTFDIMKGIGILLVITCHFWGWNHPYLARSITSFHMPMFFIVAGYFSKSYTGWDSARQHVKHFFSRLCIPYAFSQLMVVGWAVVLAFAHKGGWNSVIKETLSLFWADIYGPLTPWGSLTLGILWFLIALFVAKTLLLLFISRFEKWGVPISFALAIAAIVAHKFFPYSIWCISSGLTALPFVTIGWRLKKCVVPFWVYLLFIIGWLVAILYSELDMYCFIWKHYPLDVIGAFGGTGFLFLISKLIATGFKKIGKAMAYLGVISLAIMCAHNFEVTSHLGDRTCALLGISLPGWGLFMWRYVLTIAMAVAMVNIPMVKKMFV